MAVWGHIRLLNAECLPYYFLYHCIYFSCFILKGKWRISFLRKDQGGAVWNRQTFTGLQCGRPGFNPLVGRISWRRKWLPTPVFLPGKSYGRRSLVGYSPRVAKSQIRLSDFTFVLFKLVLEKWSSIGKAWRYEIAFLYLETYMQFVIYAGLRQRCGCNEKTGRLL